VTTRPAVASPASPVRRGWALNLWHTAHRRLLAIDRSTAIRIVIACALLSLVLKLVNIVVHYGFWTGDDVEIHEMTLSALFGWNWRAWELRSPFYPMTFVYPIQWVLFELGARDPFTFVLGGRAAVALISTASVLVLFKVAERATGSVRVALLSAMIFAFSKLHIIGGSTELPRTVSSLFVLVAFWLLMSTRRPPAAAALSGALLGIAAAMRFSEEVFLLPAAVQFALNRRWRDLALSVASFAVVVIAILGAGDALYWGRPFYSSRQIVDFTLVQRLSSRGYERWYAYVASIPRWTDVVTIGFALAGIRSCDRAVALWAGIPVFALSLLPHKEPRYLIPILPYVSILAAAGFAALLARIVAAPTSEGERVWQHRRAAALLVAVFAAIVMEASGYRLIRSERAVDVARFINQDRGRRGVAAEQIWQLGGRIYLSGHEPVIDIDPTRIGDPEQIQRAVRDARIEWVALLARDAGRFGYDITLQRSGFDEVSVDAVARSPYRLFRRAP